MRNFLSALARALKGCVYAPFWMLDNTWDAFKTALRPRVSAETEYAAEEAQQAVADTKKPKFDEMSAVVTALRVIGYNAKNDYDDALPMRLDGIDFRWSEWLCRLDAQSAQRAVNAEKSRPGALAAHRSGEMKMIGIPRVRTEDEYKKDNEDEMSAARDDLVKQAMKLTPEQEASLLKPLDDVLRGVFQPK